MELNLNNEEAKINEDYYLRGNMEAGIEGVLIKNDQLFNEVKSKDKIPSFTPSVSHTVLLWSGIGNAFGGSMIFTKNEFSE